MDSTDVPFIVEMITLNLSNFRIVPDRLHQGMLNALSLMRLVKVNLLFIYFPLVLCGGTLLFFSPSSLAKEHVFVYIQFSVLFIIII